jgi:hypothetical protein
MTDPVHTASWGMLGEAQAAGYVTYLQAKTLVRVAQAEQVKIFGKRYKNLLPVSSMSFVA